MSRFTTTVWREVRWLSRGMARSVRAHPGQVVIVVAACWLMGARSLWVLIPVAVLVAGLRVWQLQAPRSFARASAPILGLTESRRIRAMWPHICVACELGETPGRLRVHARWPRVELRTRLALGQTCEDFGKAAEALRSGLRATQIRVEPAGVSSVMVGLTFGDALAAPFTATVGGVAANLGHVVMGQRSDGALWRLPLGPHTLVAGSSGSGKGSVFWSFVFGLAPEVREGRVQLHGIDLKGGMEILMGEGLFTTTATTPGEAVALLELLVGWMRARTKQYAGRLRTHMASVEEPVHVVMIDELAALTAYSTDRELQRRAEIAINLLCSQGRAPGFVVFACLQDPRKEVIPSRGLFTQMVGLRLKDLSETSMVLGEVAVETGAHCHRITSDMPGTGYVVPEEGGQPIRVRAGFASDEAIREVAARFASPVNLSVLPVVVEPRERLRRVERPGR